MKELHDRINRVIHTASFAQALEEAGIDLFELQCDWHKYPNFNSLPVGYRQAIEAGEAELSECGMLELV